MLALTRGERKAALRSNRRSGQFGIPLWSADMSVGLPALCRYRSVARPTDRCVRSPWEKLSPPQNEGVPGYPAQVVPPSNAFVTHALE